MVDNHIEGPWFTHTKTNDLELRNGKGVDEVIPREKLLDLLDEESETEMVKSTLNGQEDCREIHLSKKGHIVPSTDNGITMLLYKNAVEKVIDPDSERKWGRAQIFEHKKDDEEDEEVPNVEQSEFD